MSPSLYKLYLLLTKAKKRIHSKVRPSGRLLLFFAAMSILFGVNTKQTMIYQLAALLVMLLLFSFPFSFVFFPTVRIRRILPKTCTAGEKLTYVLHLENTGKKPAKGLVYKEQSAALSPTFADFNSTFETGEKDRNFFDRKLGYYRWSWLIQRFAGARFKPFSLPKLMPGEHTQFRVSLLPLRRGYIHIGGYTLHRPDPLGLFKNEVFFRDAEKLLILPRMYPVAQADLDGARKYHKGGLTTAASCGESGEFVSLRDYRPGDPVKHIDWKVSARSGSSIVRQYQDEYFSRYGILLDTFTGQQNIIFENAVSVAASIIVGQETARNSIDLLFAGDTCISTIAMGPGQSDQHHMLEVLACITNCRDQEFDSLADLVIAHTNVLSGLIVLLIKIDEKRQRLINYLDSTGIPHRIMLISDDIVSDKKLLHSMSLPNVTIFDVKSEIKLVDLA